jgi:thiol-disulfide isomerase/thioredoxin
MNPRRALIVFLVLGGVALTWAATEYSRSVRRSGSPATASVEPAPGGDAITLRFFKNPASVADFTVKDLDGRTISSSSFKGKVTIINFWATWCGPCRAEIPDLVALQQKYRDQLQVIGISEDEVAPEVVKRFADQFHVNYPVAMVTPDLEKKFGTIVALPTSYILDRDARIVQKHVGMLRRDVTEAETRALAGLAVNATIEHVDQTQGLKLENSAQATTIPGLDLSKLSTERRMEALQKLNEKSCTCGCDLTVARCRVDDPNCSVSLPLARQILKELTGSSQ